MSSPLQTRLGTLCLLWFASCAVDAARAGDAIPTDWVAVRVSAVERGPVNLPVHGAGTLGARRELDLAFKTGGVLARVLVEAGARVEKGQLLALVDPLEYGAQLARARQGVEKAERDYARSRQLRDSGALAQAQTDDAHTSLKLARAEASVASFNLQHSRLLAPESGVVNQVLVTAGEIMAPGRPVLRMSLGAGQVARVGLIDRDALAVHSGDRAELWVDARPGEPLAARVTRIANVPTPGTGTYTVELTIDDGQGGALPSGLSVKAEIERMRDDLVRVPVSALVDAQGHDAAVFVLEGERVRRTAVKIHSLTPNRALLETPLSGAQTVVEIGALHLHDGSKVQVFH